MTPSWRLLLGGMIVWIGHFAVIYIASLIWGSAWPAKLVVAAATLLALGMLAWLARRLLAWRPEGFDSWVREVALLLSAVACISVLWQATPALFA